MKIKLEAEDIKTSTHKKFTHIVNNYKKKQTITKFTVAIKLNPCGPPENIKFRSN